MASFTEWKFRDNIVPGRLIEGTMSGWFDPVWTRRATDGSTQNRRVTEKEEMDTWAGSQW